MVDFTPSSDMDDLFGLGASGSGTQSIPLANPAPARQFSSRREAREATASAPGSAFGLLVPAEQPVRRSELRAARRSSVSRPSDDRRARRHAQAAERRAHKLSRSQAALVHDAMSKGQRKNPLSVLVTMGMVGGIFAVAALPAYAMTDSSGTDVASAKNTLQSQSIAVSADAAPATPERDAYLATTPEQLAQRSRDAVRAANNTAYLASGARELGDDYPWPYELKVSQGGGLSPLNYYYRECVDFVAWRLNRDQGSYAEPFKWVWSNLTPTGGNASQWKYAWERAGWPISTVPIVGSVAWFGSQNHVAYVKAVNADGTVLLEEYNEGHRGLYGQRTILASTVSAFLYPPS